MSVGGLQGNGPVTSNGLPVPVVMAIAAIVCLIVGVVQGIDVARLEASGQRAQGEVIRMVGEWTGSGNDRHYVYHAFVQFRTASNETIKFEDGVGHSRPGYQRGDKVTVLYNAAAPAGHAMIDRGLFWNWATPVIAILAAAVLGGLSAAIFARGRAADDGTPSSLAAAR
jgi:hypothetical protein